MENKRLLLIIDPQIDFISGTLPVPNAGEAMTELARYVTNQGSDYTAIVATTDWHPYHHMSFATENGPWPVHCVQNSIGAALPDDLIAACSNSGCPFVVLRKGNSADREEYSIMQNAASAALLDEIIGKEAYNGDTCLWTGWKHLRAEHAQRPGRKIWQGYVASAHRLCTFCSTTERNLRSISARTVS